jgi:hypothetical protein
LNPRLLRRSRSVRNRAEPSLVPLGLFLILWGVLALESWRLPGARWLAEHTPLWVIWSGLLLIPISLVCIYLFDRMLSREEGAVVPLCAVVLAHLGFLVPMLFAGIWGEYRFGDRAKLWVGALGLPICLGAAVWGLARGIWRRSAGH